MLISRHRYFYGARCYRGLVPLKEIAIAYITLLALFLTVTNLLPVGATLITSVPTPDRSGQDAGARPSERRDQS